MTGSLPPLCRGACSGARGNAAVGDLVEPATEDEGEATVLGVS